MKKTNTILSILSIILICFTNSIFAQRICGYDIMRQQMLLEQPELKQIIDQIERHTAEYIAQPKGEERAIITIPVVFHIVWRTSNPNDNVSDAKIVAQLDLLNKDFRKLNADASTPNAFSHLAADCEIQFCLAARDPNNRSTNGIMRYESSNTGGFFANNSLQKVKSAATGGADAWDASKYLNIWVCNIEGTVGGGTILGATPTPGGAAAFDGVVIDFSVIGGGRVGTHEVGHWLNLIHLWGPSNANCGDDLVGDTPLHFGPNFGCPGANKTNTCAGKTNTEMTMNYMDYTDGECQFMFTHGQKARMRAALAGPRASLVNSIACSPVSCLAPSGLTATAISANGATINWIASTTGAASYTVKYKTLSATDWITISNVNGTSRVLTGLAASTTYVYQILPSCSATSNIPYVNAIFTTTANVTTCPAPTITNVSNVSSNSATINWTPIIGASSYKIIMKSGWVWSNIATVTTNNYTFTGLSPSTNYSYRVQAVCGALQGGYSPISGFTTLAKPACNTANNIPLGLVANPITTNSATINWESVTGASAYKIQYKAITALTWTPITVGAITNRAITGLLPATTYQYKVATVCGTSASAFSAIASFRTNSTVCCSGGSKVMAVNGTLYDSMDGELTPEEVEKFDVSIIPNPAREAILLNFSTFENTPTSVTFYNMLGQVVLSQEVFLAQKELPMDISNLDGGLYIVNITQGINRKTIKLLIQN